MTETANQQAGRLLILASASPRRRELMQKLLRPFISEVSRAKEYVPAEISAGDTAEYLSGIKAEEIFRHHTEEELVVIGSDTIVLSDGVIYGKPKDEADAKRMLESLSGKTHEVRTGVTILWRKKNGSAPEEGRLSFTSVTEVTFYKLSEAEIDAYVATGEPMDKAGAYGIQDEGALLVKSINGDYYTVVGFPIGEVNRRLKEHEL